MYNFGIFLNKLSGIETSVGASIYEACLVTTCHLKPPCISRFDLYTNGSGANAAMPNNETHAEAQIHRE